MPTVAVDARELAGHPTGVGRYLLELLKRWDNRSGAVGSGYTFIPYAHQPLAAGTPFLERAVVLPGTGGTRWEQLTFASALRRNPPDILFAPASTAPLTVNVPIALTIHDLSYVAHPEWFRSREGLRRRLLTRLSAQKASVVLTVSAFSAGEIVERLGIPPSKVRVIYHGARNETANEAPNEAKASCQEPLVLFVGSLFNRRHVPALLHAFAHVSREMPSTKLVIVGDNRTYPREDPLSLAASLGIGNRVEVRDYAPDHEIAALYRRAAVFVFVSEYEGFGLTPLDALAYGVPIVVADTALSREIYGDAAVTVPAGDAHALSEAVLLLLKDAARRQAALDAAPAVLARYSWDRAAAETLAAMDQIAAKRVET
jgi:glycosyltransferase involved in cell wall biosynthesis